MSIKYLNLSGLEDLWINIKNYILSKIPTKTSELTNDSGYLTSHQSLANYVTTNTDQDIEGNKNFKGLLTTIPNGTIWPVTASTTDDITYLGANAIHVEQKGSGKLTDLSGGAWSVAELGVGCFFFRINNGADIRYKNFAQNTVNRIPVVSGANRFINDVTPNENNTYSLGTSSLRWKECYSNAYYLGTTAFGDIVTHNASEFLTSHQSLSSCVKNVVTNSQSIKSTAITRGTAPSSTQTFGIPFNDNNDKRIGNVYGVFATDKSTYVGLYAYKGTTTSNGDNASVRVGYDASGNAYTYAPTPATTDNSTQIATTAFVKAQGYITGSGNTTGSSGSCTGNAATATQFSANTTVALTGDATGTSAGSKKGWSVPVTLANSGVTAGDYGPSANASPSHGGTFSVPYVTVDAKGRVTAASTKTITLPADSNTDTKVTQTVTTGNSTYPVLLCATANATATETTTSRFSAGLTVNTRYSSIYITNKYDTANTKGVRNTSSYNNGILYFRSYDDTQMGLIRCDSHKNGYQHIYMQASNYIKDGAINPKGTATTCSIAVRVRDNGGKTIYTEGSWENSLTPYANETYDLGTSSLKWLGCYCKNFYGSYVDIAGRYIGNEYSTNARTCLYLKSNRDTDGKSGIYFSKFRQNRAQGALTGSDLVDLSLDVLENSVRTNSCISISFRYFENDVPTKIYVIPKKSATSYMGTSDNPWTNAYITNLNLNGNAFDPTSIDGVGTVKLLAYLPTSSQEYTMNAGTIKAGSNLGEVWAFDAKSDSVGYLSSNMSMTQSGTWKLLNFVSVGGNPVGCKVIGLWVKIA